MVIDRRLYSDLRRLDRHDLRRIAIFVGGLLHSMGDEFSRVETPAAADRVSYRLESVRCGKPNCRSCPHGPYWYAYYRDQGRLRSRYIGRELPDDVKKLLSGSSGLGD